MLTTDFKKTPAYKFGFIDSNGNRIKKLPHPTVKGSFIQNEPKTKEEKNSLTPLHRLVFNLKRLLKRVGLGSRFATYAAAAIAFLIEEYPNNPYIEQEVTKYLRENGLKFDVNENYGEPLSEGSYKVRHDIYDLDGEVIINKDEDIEYNGNTDTVMGYDVFKYKNTYLTTEDLYANT